MVVLPDQAVLRRLRDLEDHFLLQPLLLPFLVLRLQACSGRVVTAQLQLTPGRSVLDPVDSLFLIAPGVEHLLVCTSATALPKTFRLT